MKKALKKATKKISVDLITTVDLIFEQYSLQKILQSVNDQAGGLIGVRLECSESGGLLWEKSLIIFLVGSKSDCPDGDSIENKYQRARDSNLDIWFYFRSIPEEMLADPGEQLKKVLKLRSRIEVQKSHYFRVYEDFHNNLAEQLKKDLFYWLCGITPVFRPGKAEDKLFRSLITGQEKDQFLRNLREHQRMGRHNHRLAEAVNLVMTAEEEVGLWHPTKAEEYFAKACYLYSSPDLMLSYGLFLEEIGCYKKAQQQYNKVLRLGIEAEDPGLRAEGYYCLGALSLTVGKLKYAERTLGEALKFFEERNLTERAADIKIYQGMIFSARKELPLAREQFEEALKVYIELGKEEKLIIAYVQLGYMYREHGYSEQAEAMFNTAITYEKQLQRDVFLSESVEVKDTGGVYYRIGKVYFSEGNLISAEEFFNKARVNYCKHGDTLGICAVFLSLGEVYLKRGHLKGAQEAFKTAAVMSLCSKDNRPLAEAYINLGKVVVRRGSSEEAKDYFNKAIGLETITSGTKEGAAAYTELGKIFFREDNFLRAEKLFNTGLAIWEQLGQKNEVAQVSESLGDIYYILGRYKNTLAMYNRALHINKETDCWEGIARILCRLGEAYRAMKRQGAAKSAFQKALDINQECGFKEKVVEIALKLGALCCESGQIEEAKRMYSKAIRVGENIGLSATIAEAFVEMANIYYKEGDFAKSESLYSRALNIFEKYGNEELAVEVYVKLGNIYLESGDIDRAKGMKEAARVMVTKRVEEKMAPIC